MKLKIRILFSLLTAIFLIGLLHNSATAQKISAVATLDTNAILIGEQTKLTLYIEYKTDEGNIKIEFPTIADTIINKIDVVSKSKVELFLPDSNDLTRLAQIQTFIITSFDSGYYDIPSFKFKINGDTGQFIETDPLQFSVNTLAIDTTQNIKDIKPPMDVPFSWKEYLPYIYAGIGGLAILTVLVILIIKYLKNRKKLPAPIFIPPVIPAHVTALAQLEKLKESKLWQQGKLKQYHSELTDIIRQYLEQRFLIPAMEQVTHEIMYSLRTTEVSEEQKTKLRQVLILSDLVKFAKEEPMPTENELSWDKAYAFILETKPEIIQNSTIESKTNDPNKETIL